MGSWAVCGVTAVFLSAASEEDEVFLLDGDSVNFSVRRRWFPFSTPCNDMRHCRIMS